MPLRSVEAATRDDAIAAAREQFGPSTRVVGVRRVRSGGVLGFFATERYVAEVAPDPTNRPVLPVTTAATTGLTEDVPADFSSPLASAAPARARAAAPARNGAAAWAAEAASPLSASSSSSFPSASRSAAPAARSSAPSWPAAAPKQPAPVDDEVSELASLLSAKQAEADTPVYGRSTFPRAAFPRTAASHLDDVTAGPIGRDGDKRVIPADIPDAPSPFTAALARMVAGDKEVRQAVEEALVRPGAARPGADAGPRPTRPGRTTESPVPSPAARQEEETVGDQVIAPSSNMTQTVEVPTWAAEPEVTGSSVTSREEAIAEVLRSALAQGHSDEALAGILRKVLAGASPQTALTAPDAESPQAVLEDDVPRELAVSPTPPASVVPETVGAEIVVPEVAVEDVAPAPATAEIVEAAELLEPATPVFETPAYETPAYQEPVYETPMFTTPTFEVPVFETPAAADARPTWTPAPAWVAAPATSMWGPPSASATLWSEAAAPAVTPSAPIWAASESPEPLAESVDAPLFDELVEAEGTPDVHAAAVDGGFEPELDAEFDAEFVAEFVAEPPAESVVEFVAEPVSESVLEEAVLEESVVEELAEPVAEELAPLMARTASDPAPMMSFDSTSVMPPLSLLPPLPGSRGRGRPPVPPSANRRGVSAPTTPSVRTPAPTTAEPAAPVADAATAPADDDVWAPAVTPAQAAPVSRSLATVTRLPVAPLMAGEEIPEHLFESVALFTEPLIEPAAAVAPEVIAVEATPVALASGDVADRLVELGVPRALLGATFADDVTERGTYSALTRALALHLPKAPELPSGAGEVLFVVGPGVETLRAAQTLAASLRLDPDRVQWATRGDLAGLAPQSSRVTTVGAALDRRQDADVAGTVTIVAVDAPMRADAYWTAQMMAIWTPVAVWAVVEATRKPEDLEPWIDGLPQVDALIVQDTDLSADPAAVLRRVDAPVALLDGARATPHRWASLLCERLENPQT